MNRHSWQMARWVLKWLMVAMLAVSASAHAQSEPSPIKPEEIEALVAPIALYPDTLLSQVLMASTYPLEVVQAARWVKANPNVKGEAAVKAVEKESWDISVKSLVAFPQVLEPMSDKIDWTQKLGDAVLADESAVLDAVQRLRLKAEQSGNLKSNEQQKVVVEQPAPQEKVIIIESANPEVIYVPAYNPTVVYGSWGYPAYPPYYWPPYPAYYPGGALAYGFAWGVGIAAAGAIFGDCDWDHHHGGDKIKIDIDRTTNIDRNFDRSKVSSGKWQHDASHRKGVSYRDSASRSKYGKDVPGADVRRDFRGREGGVAGVSDRAGVGDRGGAGDRDRAGDRGSAGDRGGVSDRGGAGVSDRSRTPDRGGAGDRSGAGVSDRAGSYDRGGSRDSGAFQGVNSGGSAQRDFNRGSASNRSYNSSRGSYSGGASRGGGGFSGGGSRGGGGGRGGGGRR